MQALLEYNLTYKICARNFTPYFYSSASVKYTLEMNAEFRIFHNHLLSQISLPLEQKYCSRRVGNDKSQGSIFMVRRFRFQISAEDRLYWEYFLFLTATSFPSKSFPTYSKFFLTFHATYIIENNSSVNKYVEHHIKWIRT